MQLFARKPIADLQPAEGPHALRRVLGAGDLIMLAIGAVIGAGIFSSIGTAAAGEIRPDGEIVRYTAPPRVFEGKDTFYGAFFELLDEPVTLVLRGKFVFDDDVGPFQ